MKDKTSRESRERQQSKAVKHGAKQGRELEEWSGRSCQLFRRDSQFSDITGKRKETTPSCACEKKNGESPGRRQALDWA